MAETARNRSGSPDEDLAAAIVQIKGQHGRPGGAGFLIASDLVLTCAHVVSDALGTPRQEPVPEGTPVTVELALSRPPAGGERASWQALVEHWVPIRAERTGDIAVLRLPGPIPGADPLPMADHTGARDGHVRAVGFTRDAPGGTWFEGRLVGPTAEGWVQLSRATGQAVPVRPGFSGGPVWDDTLRVVVGMLVAAQPEGETQQAYALRTSTILEEVPALGPVVRPPSPFRGLETYAAGDVFHGRDREIADVVTALSGDRTAVTLYGPSGCGKSSLVLAGVVPRMRDAGYKVLVVDAGRISSPRAALATELFEAIRSERPPRASGADQVEGWLRDLGLADTLHRAWGSPSAGPLVVLDQAEALLYRTRSEIDELVDLLFPPRRGPAGGPRVLLTLRSDLMDAVLKHPRLGPALRDGATLPLTPMSRDQLQEVVTKPVKPPVAYDPGLVRRILDDAGDEPGILPLLGFVLRRLWEQMLRHADGRLRTADYEAMRGVSGALEQHAGQAWRECVGDDAEAKAAAVRLLAGLVQVPPGGEMPVRRTLTRAEAGEHGWRLAEAFARRRLLVLRGGEDEPETAELAHEALIASWPALRDVVREDRAFLAGRADLEYDRRRWEHDGRPAERLPARTQLVAIGRWLGSRESELSEEQREYLELARHRHRSARRRIRLVWVALGLVVALIVSLGTFLGVQTRISAERDAERRSLALAGVTEEMAANNPGLAALTAIAAYRTASTQGARNALLRLYDRFKDAAWTLSGVQGTAADAAMSGDGSVTLVTSESGRATLFVRHSGGSVLRRHLDLAGNALAPLVSRDGRRIAYVLDAAAWVWHDVRVAENDIIVGPAHRPYGGDYTNLANGGANGEYDIAALSPGAGRLAAVAVDGRLQVWNLAEQRLQPLPPGLPRLRQVWFGADDDTLIGVRSDGGDTSDLYSMVAVDLRTGKTRELEKEPISRTLKQVGVSADGGVLVVCRQLGVEKPTYAAVRVADGQELTRYIPDTYTGCREPALDRTGERFAIDEGEGNWVVLDTRPDRRPQRFAGLTTGYGDPGMAGPLLGDPGDPVLVHRSATGVTGWRLFADAGDVTTGRPVLLDHGKKMLLRLGERNDRLAVKETEGRERTLAEVRVGATTPPDGKQELAVNSKETLMADVTGHNRVTIRDLPGLRTVAEFTVRMPPTGQDGKPGPVTSFFMDDQELVTVSGEFIEHWNVRDGRRLSDPLDIRALGIDGVQPTRFAPSKSGLAPGHVQITNLTTHTLHAIDLRTRKENPGLRIVLGPDMLAAGVKPDGRLALVLTRGSLIEIWSVRDRRRPHRLLGPFGPLDPAGADMANRGASGYYLASLNTVRFITADTDRVGIDSYSFPDARRFLASADGGDVLLMSPPAGGRMVLFRLDPELWQRHLCAVVGRDLTQDERVSLPSEVPDVLCPSR